MQDECKRIGYEHVPVLYVGHGSYHHIATNLIDKIGSRELESHLGGQIEGINIIIKFKERGLQKGSYKHVIDLFKEQREGKVHMENVTSSESTTGIIMNKYIEELGSMFATEARFLKAVQHIQEEALELTRENMRYELDNDFQKEYKDIIKEVLWNEFSHDIMKYAKEGYTKYC